MSTIGQLFNTPGSGLQKVDQRPAERQATADRTARPVDDRLELSAEAQAEQTRTNTARIQQIRAELAEGTYLTDDKLDVAIDRLTRELLGGD